MRVRVRACVCVCVRVCVCARENSPTAASHNASVKAASKALGSSCLKLVDWGPSVSAPAPRLGRGKHVEMSGPPLQWLGHEEFKLDVVRALRFGRWREALVGQVLRQGGAPDALAPLAIQLLGLDRETQLLKCWDQRHLRLAFEWWGNPWRMVDMGWPRADEEDATEDLVAADETWIREVMEESGVGWPRVHEEGATTWLAQGLDLVGHSDLCIG